MLAAGSHKMAVSMRTMVPGRITSSEHLASAPSNKPSTNNKSSRIALGHRAVNKREIVRTLLNIHDRSFMIKPGEP
jgi:hypothetical protein